MIVSMRISVVTFNKNEKAAVEQLLNDLADGTTPWGRDNQTAIKRTCGEDVWTLDHVALLGQGNVVAAAELARQYRAARGSPNYVVFYGCAGALDEANTGSVFLVESVNYLSLGTVDAGNTGAETITLKNKWFCYTDPPAGVEPLLPIRFPLAKQGSQMLEKLAPISTARVAATDKVIHVLPREAPSPLAWPPPRAEYEALPWTYAQGLGLIADSGEDVLVEMESYGIARIANSLEILNQVIVMRVTTDALTDHGVDDDGRDRQERLLMDARPILGHLLDCLFSTP